MIFKETKGSFKSLPLPYAYFVPSRNETIKVEKVYHAVYCAHYPEGLERVTLPEMEQDKWKCLGKWEKFSGLKTCSKCETEMALDKFSKNDYGEAISQCTGCISKKGIERYLKRKLAREMSENETDLSA